MTSKTGVPRVVWRRLRKPGEDVYDSIPFLNVSRSLGDYWSFNASTQHFTVSPKPDVHVHPLNLKEQRFVVVASDGLWNVMSPEEVVRYIWDYEHNEEECCKPNVVQSIIEEALRRWQQKNQPADNITVLITFLNEAVIEEEAAKSSGKHERTEGDDDDIGEALAEKRLKIEEPVVDDDSGVCSDDNLQESQPLTATCTTTSPKS